MIVVDWKNLHVFFDRIVVFIFLFFLFQKFASIIETFKSFMYITNHFTSELISLGVDILGHTPIDAICV